jgi:hypothetical protein
MAEPGALAGRHSDELSFIYCLKINIIRLFGKKLKTITSAAARRETHDAENHKTYFNF